jgi:hypothetical protein
MVAERSHSATSSRTQCLRQDKHDVKRSSSAVLQAQWSQRARPKRWTEAILQIHRHWIQMDQAWRSRACTSCFRTSRSLIDIPDRSMPVPIRCGYVLVHDAIEELT